MSSENIIELEASKVWFLSQQDETNFFEWLNKIQCVRKCEGGGFSIFIDVDADALTEEDLRELIAVFHRYEVSMRQLSVFDKKEFASWFRNEQAYWFSSVFGES